MDSLAAAYCDLVGARKRRALGQFFTPVDIAAFMCHWVLGSSPADIFDPAFGLGSFYFAAQAIQPSMPFSGTDVDAGIIEFFQRRGLLPRGGLCKVGSQSPGLRIRCEDYLLSWGQTHAAIVCNPPYMRFQHFANRTAVFDCFQKNLGVRLSGYTNTASAFLLKSLSELSRGGRLAYIMPLEFLNTGYGTIVKQRLLEHGALKALIKLDPEKEVFPDATTTVGIILASNDGKREPVRFYTVAKLGSLPDLLSLQPKRTVPIDQLEASEKWLKYFEDGQFTFTSPDLVPIAYYGAFTRGIATGANEFFAMSASKAHQFGIPRSALLDCIARSAQVKSCVFTKTDFEALKRSDANVFLLDAQGLSDQGVGDYIRYGEQCGYHLRYLTRVRTPWYKLERRHPAPLLFGVFSRQRFKVVRNLSAAVTLTCYHCFYPNLFGQQFLDSLFLYFQSCAARMILRVSMRRYGDGLEKFEPNDLNRALAPSPAWFSRFSAHLVEGAVESCRQTNTLPSELQLVFDSLVNAAEPYDEPHS